MLEQVGGFADGVAVKVVGEENFQLCRELVDGVVLVGQDAICASIKVSWINTFTSIHSDSERTFFFFFFVCVEHEQDMFNETRCILEPAGALSLVGAEAYCRYYGPRGETVVAVTSGANMIGTGD